jgi:hypothetical protein
MVVKKGLVVILAVILVVTFVGQSEATVIAVIERNCSVSVVGNENAYLSISTTTPIIVNEGQSLDTQFLVFTNRLSDNPMYVSTILPSSVTETGFTISGLSYAEGPYFGEEECQISIHIGGLAEGVYKVFYEVEAFWGSDLSSASSVTHVYNIEVTIIVQTSF